MKLFPKILTVATSVLLAAGFAGLPAWAETSSPQLVQDIRSGSNSSNPYSLTVFNDKLYFSANDSTNGQELWVYDGTNATMVQDIRSGSANSSPSSLTVFNDKLTSRLTTAPTVKNCGSTTELTQLWFRTFGAVQPPATRLL